VLSPPLSVAPPTPELAAAVRARLEARWMPGDWFMLDDRVAGHYAWKAAVFAAALRRRPSPLLVKVIEIGTRSGYSLQAFAEGAVSERRAIQALCFDAYLDDDSRFARNHFHNFNNHGTGIDDAVVVTVNARDLIAIPVAPFAHVDGEHTADGVLRDLNLCWHSDVILADDCDNPEVMQGVREWLARNPARHCQFIDDGLRTLAVISTVYGPTGPRL